MIFKHEEKNQNILEQYSKIWTKLNSLFKTFVTMNQFTKINI